MVTVDDLRIAFPELDMVDLQRRPKTMVIRTVGHFTLHCIPGLFLWFSSCLFLEWIPRLMWPPSVRSCMLAYGASALPSCSGVSAEGCVPG